MTGQRVRRQRVTLERLDAWLASPAGRACVHRPGRPSDDGTPLVRSAAQAFGVDRRTIQRALARRERRQRLLAEQEPVSPAQAAMLLNAAKSFTAAHNATSDPGKPRRREGTPSRSTDSQRFTAREATPEAIVGMLASLIQQGFFDRALLERMQRLATPTESMSIQQDRRDPWAAVGLQVTVHNTAQTPTRRPDPVHVALLDALDAWESGGPPLSAEQRHAVQVLRTMVRP
jgi:hypothetical protein